MLQKIKSVFSKKSIDVRILNEDSIADPFLSGSLLENRRISNFIFMKDSTSIKKALIERNFVDYDRISDDEIYEFIAKNQLVYNSKYHLLIALIPEVKCWDTLNTCINIAENTTDDTETQIAIILEAFYELNDKT